MFVTTFFSYKGGVGRTMALVNVAALLARAGRRVLVVDFDLEAPGVPSYGPLAAASGLPGIVDYVTEYRVTRKAPAVEDYLVECHLAEGQSIWVLPAGDNASPAYSDRFAAIDWNVLYEREDGFLMFDDMRRQWGAFGGLGFDYVLIDSRTGHTDVGGICTRQLPDAVVVMFVPTAQNVDGLQPIVASIRRASAERDTPIELLFCPSNVPDQYDEDETLGGLLAAAGERLAYGSPSELKPPAVRVHHWTNMELLQQPIVVESRPRSRLAKEYAELKKAIISENPEDREGAVYALQRMSRIYEAARAAVDGEVAIDILRRTKRIARMHPEDGEIALMAAETFSGAGDIENEELNLGTAIRKDFKASRARLLRAAARANLNRQPEALDDVRKSLSSPSGTVFEFRPAVQLLRAIADDPIEEALGVFHTAGTRPRAKVELAQLLMQRRDLMDVVADGMLAILEGDPKLAAEARDDVRNVGLLALTGGRRFAEARTLAAVDSPDAIASDLFNGAVAEWGERGRPPTRLFESLDRKLPSSSGDANVNQCMALVRSVVGKTGQALDDLTEAAETVVPSGLVFSCWTFTYKPAVAFIADVQEMRKALERGQALVPPFLGTDSDRAGVASGKK